MIFQDAVYVIDFYDEPIYILVAQYKNTLRGLRSNKVMVESIDCLKSITKFKKVVLRISIPWSLKCRERMSEAVMLVYEFLEKNGPPNMTISFDLLGVFQYYYGSSQSSRAYAEKMTKDVEGFLGRSQRCTLERLTSRLPNRAWPQRTATMIKDLYKRTNQTMLKPGETLLLSHLH